MVTSGVLPGEARAQLAESPVFPVSDSAAVRVGDLRSLVGGLLVPDANTTEGFTVIPSLGVQFLATDNVQQQAHPRTADFATFFNPAINVAGQSSRIQANLAYTPSFQVYAVTSRQDQIAQNFNGQVLLTGIPNLLFLNLRGYGAEQSTTANAGQSTSPVLSQNNRTQTLGLTASPYLTHRFGGDATATVGYVYDYTQQTGANAFGPTTLPIFGTQSPLITNQSLLANNFGQTFGNATTRTSHEYASIATGENFGRFNDSLRLDASQLRGSGVLGNARRTTAIDSFGIGITRTYAVVGSLGYEDINYAGIPPVHIRDAVYSGGIRFTPNQDSTLTVTYGHKDGFNSPTVSASYQATARLRVFAAYSQGLTTSQQQIQDNLSSSTVDQFGNSIDSVTGAPVLIDDQLLGLQSGLFRLQRFSATAVLTYDVDLFSFNILNENRTVLSVSSGQSGNSDQGTSGSVTWNHQFTPDINGTATLQYGVSTTQTRPSTTQNNATLVLQTGYALSQTLTANAEYYVSNLSSNVAQGSYVQNVFLIGLRKSF